MTTDLDQLLHDRFAHSAPPAEPPDWADVVERARGHSKAPRRGARRRLLLVAAALLGVFAVAGSAIAISGTGTGIRAIDEILDRASQPRLALPPDAPGVDVRPVEGSISPPLSFERGGKRYTAVGFRARAGGVICAALADPAATAPRMGGVGCLSERGLRQALADSPVHLFAGGGPSDERDVQGFARADVVSVSTAGGGTDIAVGLSEPWKPEPWDGEPIRFIYIVMTAPESAEPAMPSWQGLRLMAKLASGESVEIAR